MPERHDGQSEFTFKLHFSEAPEDLSYTMVGGSLLDVTGGEVKRAGRVTGGSNLAWNVTIKPTRNDTAVQIELPVRACTNRGFRATTTDDQSPF